MYYRLVKSGSAWSVALAVAVLSACSKNVPTTPGSIPDLKNAPTSIVLAGKTLTLGTYLWRDFQPIAPVGGRPLIGVLRVETADASAVPSSTRAEAVWVISGQEVWTATSIEERPRAQTAPVYELVVRDGPKWGPNISVDVVVSLRDVNGTSVLLRAANQLIQATS